MHISLADNASRQLDIFSLPTKLTGDEDVEENIMLGINEYSNLGTYENLPTPGKCLSPPS